MTANGHRLYALEPGGLDLGPWGRLEILDRRHLGVRTTRGRIREIDVGGVLEASGRIIGWLDPDSGLVLLATIDSALVRLDLTTDEVERIAALDRDDEPDFRFLQFHEAEGRIFCLYERGLVCLDRAGRVLWHVRHRDLSAEFKGVENDAVWLASQWPPDRVGYRSAYRLSDGEQVLG
jgi:hypothetical protein